ncbi:hypothetical protein DTL36_15480 [Bremerella cremea]|nr:hypothetical protein DTL36_15480 [Bremerella cremea]
MKVTKVGSLKDDTIQVFQWTKCSKIKSRDIGVLEINQNDRGFWHVGILLLNPDRPRDFSSCLIHHVPYYQAMLEVG